MLDKVEKNLTMAILRFVTWTSNDSWVEILMKRLVNKTSKAVKFALATEYQQTMEIFEHQQRY
jgi:hypothetical protein